MAALVKTCRACGREFSGGETFCPTDGARLFGEGTVDRSTTPGDDHLVGQTLDGRYHIIDMIGQGGMGIVYEAEHVLIEKRVAVKVLRQDFTRKPDVVERFRQEARSASKIGHPNIIDVIDFGETPAGASYFVMEKLDGEDLAEVLCRECVLAPARAVNLIYHCCRALAEAHKKGIFHRDLKPENLFLVRTQAGSETVKVVDFGVAKMSDRPDDHASGTRRLTRTGMLFGTPEYMSPEQARGINLDHRADIYALGIILYELVTGRVPFEGSNFMEVLSKHGSEPLPPLTEANPGTIVSEPLRLVIERALHKDRDERFQTMDGMAEALALVPEMPTLNGDSPPPWALTAPASPTVGTTRQRISMEPMRQVTSGFWGRLRYLDGVLRPHYAKIGYATAGLFVVALALAMFFKARHREQDASVGAAVTATEASIDRELPTAGQGTDGSHRDPLGSSPDRALGSERPPPREAGPLAPDAAPRPPPQQATVEGMRYPKPEAKPTAPLPRGVGARRATTSMSTPNAFKTPARSPARVAVGVPTTVKTDGPLGSVIVGEPKSPAELPRAGTDDGTAPLNADMDAEPPEEGGTTVWNDGVVVVSSEETVAVRVTSRPAGARILPGDYHAGCASTPCWLRLPRGRSALIRARKGKARGATRITPKKGDALFLVLSEVQRDAIPPPVQRVIPPATNPLGRPGNPGSQAQAMPSPELKVPDAFR